MTDEPNPLFKKGQSRKVKESDFLTLYSDTGSPPFKNGKGKPPTYHPIKDVGIRILGALADGFPAPWVIEHFKVPDMPRLKKQNIFYWIRKGLEKGIIVELGHDRNDRRVKIYGKGSNYHLLFEEGWQYRSFLPFTCRVHSPGSAVHVVIEDYNLDSDGHITLTNLGMKEQFMLKRHERWHYAYMDTKFRMLIPFEVIGYRGAYATIYYRFDASGEDYVDISPPEVRLTLDQLSGKTKWLGSYPDILDHDQYFEGHDDDPYQNVVEYILSVFRANGWEFKGWKNYQDFHYAFYYNDVKKFYPKIWNEAAHYSGNFPEERELTIWIDHSHGKYEVETTSKWVAIEMMTILELSRKRFTGERKFPKGWGEGKFKEVGDGQVE